MKYLIKSVIFGAAAVFLVAALIRLTEGYLLSFENGLPVFLLFTFLGFITMPLWGV